LKRISVSLIIFNSFYSNFSWRKPVSSCRMLSE